MKANKKSNSVCAETHQSSIWTELGELGCFIGCPTCVSTAGERCQSSLVDQKGRRVQQCFAEKQTALTRTGKYIQHLLWLGSVLTWCVCEEGGAIMSAYIFNESLRRKLKKFIYWRKKPKNRKRAPILRRKSWKRCKLICTCGKLFLRIKKSYTKISKSRSNEFHTNIQRRN